jgi:hypothetical protein
MAGRLAISDRNDLYFIDAPQRVKNVQAEMQKAGIDVYLGIALAAHHGTRVRCTDRTAPPFATLITPYHMAAREPPGRECVRRSRQGRAG